MEVVSKEARQRSTCLGARGFSLDAFPAAKPSFKPQLHCTALHVSRKGLPCIWGREVENFLDCVVESCFFTMDDMQRFSTVASRGI